MSVAYSCGTDGLLGFGGYMTAADSDVDVLIVMDDGTMQKELPIKLETQRHWTRVGYAWHADEKVDSITISLTWRGSARLLIWGLSGGPISVPENLLEEFGDDTPGLITELHKPGLMPEALYLQHGSQLEGGNVVKSENVTEVKCKHVNVGKKCSQCQRTLPIDPRLNEIRSRQKGVMRSPQNMVIGFHGHRSKRTGYQNECRACKKFEINDHFNPIRTADQLHESSALTRERKLLLRENEALKEFKRRECKQGLRYFIWHKFGGHCFKCDREVEIDTYELDHTRPLAYLWPLDRYATCLCEDCNNHKKDSFPVEFYTPDELKGLSKLTGLHLKELSARTVNEAELKRIRSNIVEFATTWSPRLFNSVAIRVKELRTNVDLFKELEQADRGVFQRIMADLLNRPAPLLTIDAEDDEGA